MTNEQTRPHFESSPCIMRGDNASILSCHIIMGRSTLIGWWGRTIRHIIMAKFYNNASNVVSAPTPKGNLRQLPGCSLRAILVLHKCNSMLEQPQGLDQHRHEERSTEWSFIPFETTSHHLVDGTLTSFGTTSHSPSLAKIRNSNSPSISWSWQ